MMTSFDLINLDVAFKYTKMTTEISSTDQIEQLRRKQPHITLHEKQCNN